MGSQGFEVSIKIGVQAKEEDLVRLIDEFKELKKKTKAAEQAWREAEAEVKRLARAFRESGTKELAREFEQAKKRAKEAKQSFLNNQKALADLRKELTQAGVSVSHLGQEYGRLKRELEQTREINAFRQALGVKPLVDVRREIANLERAFAGLKQAHKEGRISALELYKAEANLRERITELRRETNGWTNSLKRAKAGLVALAGVGYSLMKSFSAYSEWTQRMGEVHTLVNVSAQEFERLKESILDLSTQIPQSASELASAEYNIISAGVKLKDSVQVLELSAKAAIAGVTDTKTAVQAGIGVLNAYGLGVEHLKEVYDTLFMTVKKGVTTFPELATYIGEVLPTAKLAGVSIQEVSAAIATMTKAGIRTPLAVTALNSALRNLVMPSKEAEKAMGELGIEWKGLIPTLKELTKYADRPDLLGKIIPDAEARKAVFSLMQNFKELEGTLQEMGQATGAMEEAYNKMKDTPENQLKLLQNTLNKLSIELGGLVANALLPASEALLKLTQMINQTDGPTKAFLATLATSAGAFAVWKMGLGEVVFGLKGAVLSLRKATASMTALREATLTTKAAVAGGIVISVAYAGYEFSKLIKEMKELHDVLEENKQMAAQYRQAAEQYKSAADIQILSKEKLLNLSKEEREAYKQNLIAAMKYYTNLANEAELLSNDAMLGGLLPFQSAKGKENAKKAEEYRKKVEEIIKALHELKASGKSSSDGIKQAMEKTHPVLQVVVRDVEEFKKELKKAYNEAQEGIEKYAKKVQYYEGLIRQEHESTDDLIRNLRRQTMSEEEAWEDKRLQAEEKIAKAKEEFEKGNYEVAKKFAEEAKRLYAELAQEVTKQTEDGHTIVVKSLEETTQVAIEGVKEADGVITQILNKQKGSAQAQLEEFKKRAETIKSVMAQITATARKKIELDLPNLEQVKAVLADLEKPVVKTITIVQKTEEAHQAGGLVGLQRGGKLSGYGGGDIVPALLEPGEFVLRKEAVVKYGVRLLQALNSLKVPVQVLPRFALGGMVGGWRVADQLKKVKELVVNYTIGMGFLGDEKTGREGKFGWPVNLLGDEMTEARKVYSKLKRAMDSAWGALGGWNQTFDSWYKQFDWWWKKQISAHAKEIQEVMNASALPQGFRMGGKVGGEETVNLNLILNDKSFSLTGNKSTVESLLTEIERMQAVGA